MNILKRSMTIIRIQPLLDSLKWNSLEQHKVHEQLQMLYRISSG